jgi:hypothetical protein
MLRQAKAIRLRQAMLPAGGIREGLVALGHPDSAALGLKM